MVLHDQLLDSRQLACSASIPLPDSRRQFCNGEVSQEISTRTGLKWLQLDSTRFGVPRRPWPMGRGPAALHWGGRDEMKAGADPGPSSPSLPLACWRMEDRSRHTARRRVALGGKLLNMN